MDHRPLPPDALDQIVRLLFIAMVIAVPLLGYWFMIIDLRAWLRALRGALIVVRKRFSSSTPDWARHYTPPCLVALGLELPCSESDIKRAYRRLAETLHPDRGGDRQQFMMLQHHFEEALRFVRNEDVPDET